MQNNVVDKGFEATYYFDQSSWVVHHCWCDFCMVGVDHGIGQDNVSESRICCPLACAVPWMIFKGVVFARYSKFVPNIVLHELVSTGVKMEVLNVSPVSMARQVMACFDHHVKARTEVQV